MLSIMFYLITFLIVFVVQIIAMKQKNVMVRRVLIMFSFTILLLIGLRYNVGTDYAGHVRIYSDYADKTIAAIVTGNGDIGAKVIIGVAAHVFHDYRFLFWVYGLLVLYPIYKINKITNYKYLAYSTLVFNLTIMPVCLNLVRQGAAMSFVLLAFTYLQTNAKLRKTILCLIIAACLHPSALISIPYFVLCIWARKRHGKIYVWASILTMLIFAIMVTLMKDILTSWGIFGYNYMLVVTGGINVYSGAIIYNAVYYLMFAIMLLTYKRRGLDSYVNNDDVKDEATMVVQGTFYEILGTMTRFLSRVSYYFSIYQVLLIPKILQNIGQKNTRVLMKFFCIGVLICLFVFRCYIQGYYEIIPYQTWLGN